MKEFLLVGNMNAVTYADFFPLIKEGTAQLGCTTIKKFVSKDGGEKTFGNTVWFSTLPAENKKPLILTKHYYGNEDEYPLLDNYPAINVNRIKDIPCDYYEPIAVPITILDYDIKKNFIIKGNFVNGSGKYDYGKPTTEGGAETYMPVSLYSVQNNRYNQILGFRANKNQGGGTDLCQNSYPTFEIVAALNVPIIQGGGFTRELS